MKTFGTICSGIGAPEVAAMVGEDAPGWQCLFSSEIEKFPNAVRAHRFPEVPNYGDMTKYHEWPESNPDVLIAGTPCQRSAWPDSEKDWLIRVATLRLPSLESLSATLPVGSYWRMSPVCCRTNRGLLAPSSEGWRNSGMGSPTGFWTLNTSEWPKDAAVCSLSHMLEDSGSVPPRFSLSAIACAGILRRAAKRGKELPIQLHRALEQVAGGLNAPAKPEAKTPLSPLNNRQKSAPPSPKITPRTTGELPGITGELRKAN